MFEKSENIATLALIALILGGLGFAGYELYEFLQEDGGNDGTDPTAPTLLTKAINNLGIGTSSLTFSDAASQELSHPLGSLESIFGIGADGN